MAIDPKVWNLFKFFFTTFFLPIAGFAVVVLYLGVTDYFRLFGQVAIALIAWRLAFIFYKRVVVPPKKPISYGKWAIVTGSTSGIGKDFADHLASQKMNVLVISRTEERLQEQAQALQNKHGVSAAYLAYDFTKTGKPREEFYQKLKVQLQKMDQDGGVGLLVNNVGSANEIPQHIMEFTDEEIENMIQCNINSTVQMTRAVFPFMKDKKSGAIISISSGSGNFPAPYLAVYSSTKAFMTQFTRSLAVEWWDSGVDFLVVTPYYVVSNLYKRKSGSLLAPMPIKLIEGTLAQLGKSKLVYEGHGYWMHGLLDFLGRVYHGSVARMKVVMENNRKRYDERMAAKAKAAQGADKKQE